MENITKYLIKSTVKKSEVKAWEETVMLPTYEIGKEEKNPVFIEKRVYQGSSGVVYPYPVVEKICDEKKEKAYRAVFLENEYLKQQDQEHRLSEQKNRQYQEVLKLCKMLPYGRTAEAYEEACGAAEEYGRIWQSARQELLHIQTEQIGCLDRKERIEQYRENLEEAYTEKRTYSTRAEACEIQIRQLEEYLRSPELLEKAKNMILDEKNG